MHCRNTFGSTAALLSMIVLLMHRQARSSDWPQFRGPTHDGVAEKGALTLWPAAGPKKLWSANVGSGCADVVIANGKLFAYGNNGNDVDDKAGKANQDIIYCFDAEIGKELWKQSYDALFLRVSDAGGPNATPAADDACVVTLSKAGIARCHDAATGKLLWTRDFPTERKLDLTKIRTTFQYGGVASSPVIINNIVFVCGNGLDKKTGVNVYKTKSPADR